VAACAGPARRRSGSGGRISEAVPTVVFEDGSLT
jgi:hypothetical protein